MSPRKVFLILFSLVLLAGCQPKEKHKTSLRTGRGLRGDIIQSPSGNGGNTSTAQTCGSYQVPGKLWGEITSTAGDQAFYTEIYYLMYPVLGVLPEEDQLGYISSRSNQSTGVRFWGNAQAQVGTTKLNPSTARIRIEIFDDRACRTRSDGTVRPMMPIDIGAGLESFVRADGYITSTNAQLVFEDIYGTIVLTGSFSGNLYVGTVNYTVAGYAGTRQLGQFRVPKCGFFVCN